MSHNDPEPMPVRPAGGRSIWEMVIDDVIEDMRERDQIGAAKYGGPLVANDGRRSLVDAYQEALDLAVYLKKAIVEGGCRPAPPIRPRYLISYASLKEMYRDIRATRLDIAYWWRHPCWHCLKSIRFSNDALHDRCVEPLARKLIGAEDLNGKATVYWDGRNSNR